MIIKPRNKHYSFVSYWHIAGPIDSVSSIITNPMTWIMWWPGLIYADTSALEERIVGNTIHATWKALIGYRINLQIVVTAYEPQKLITFDSSGDLEGNGSWKIEPGKTPNTTQMTILWNVTTTKTWMNRFAFLLRDIFVYSHNHLMHQGERGLNDYLHTQR